MAARFPTPGSDDGNWGTLLNDFLSVELNNDGSLKNGYKKPSGGIPNSDLSSDVQNSLFSETTIATYQKMVEYDTNQNPIYIGEAIQGAATSDSSWTVQHITYDTNNNPTLFQTADGAWDNRATLTYS